MFVFRPECAYQIVISWSLQHGREYCASNGKSRIHDSYGSINYVLEYDLGGRCGDRDLGLCGFVRQTLLLRSFGCSVHARDRSHQDLIDRHATLSDSVCYMHRDTEFHVMESAIERLHWRDEQAISVTLSPWPHRVIARRFLHSSITTDTSGLTMTQYRMQCTC